MVSGTDGVGTKLKLAFLLDRHDTVGIDCVAMCVNDIACAGGEPLFFLDYIACGKNYPEKIAQIVKGVAEGCVQAGAALIGGETAEMPGFYPEDEYDLAGFAVGVVDRKNDDHGRTGKTGEMSWSALLRAACTATASPWCARCSPWIRKTLSAYHEGLGETLGDALLRPTKIYVKALRSVKEAGVTIKGCSHITGGGFYENIPRMLPEGRKAVIRKDSFRVPEIFRMLRTDGGIEEHVMYNTYNMGIGMVLAVDEAHVERTVDAVAGAARGICDRRESRQRRGEMTERPDAGAAQGVSES